MQIEIKILNKEFYTINGRINQINYGTLPDYATSDSAGLDLRCTEDVVLYPGESKLISTGLAVWAGSSKKSICAVIGSEAVKGMGIAGFILPRSSLGIKGLVLANTIGLIDEDYQGELRIAAMNRNDNAYEWHPGKDPHTINLKAGDRIAQLVFMPVIKAQWKLVEEFSNVTERADGGFGSTGK